MARLVDVRPGENRCQLRGVGPQTRAGPRADLPDHELDAAAADLGEVLVDGGQRRAVRVRVRESVEPDHTDVVGHAAAALALGDLYLTDRHGAFVWLRVEMQAEVEQSRERVASALRLPGLAHGRARVRRPFDIAQDDGALDRGPSCAATEDLWPCRAGW